MNSAFSKILSTLNAFWRTGNSLLRVAMLFVVLWPFVATAVALSGIPWLTAFVGLIPFFALVAVLASYPLVSATFASFRHGRMVLNVFALITAVELLISIAVSVIPLRNEVSLVPLLVLTFVTFVLLRIVSGITIEAVRISARRFSSLLLLIMVIIIVIMISGGVANVRTWISATYHQLISMYESHEAAIKEAERQKEEARKAAEREAQRQAEKERTEAAKEAQRQAEEAARQQQVFEEERARRQAEYESRMAELAEAARKAEEARRAAELEAARKAEEARKEAEARREAAMMSLPLCDDAKDGQVFDLTPIARQRLTEPSPFKDRIWLHDQLLERDSLELRVEPDCYSKLYRAPAYWVETYIIARDEDVGPMRVFYPQPRQFSVGYGPGNTFQEETLREPNRSTQREWHGLGRRSFRYQVVKLDSRIFRVSAKCRGVILSEKDPSK